jgi:AraC-like DNA-binding protein
VDPPAGASLSLLHRKIFAPYKIATLIDAAVAAGISAERALAGTGLDIELIRDPLALTSIGDYVAACENILASGADPRVAFDVGARLHLPVYGMYGYALMCSPSVRDFCDFAVRYHLLATPMLRMSWRQEDDLAIWDFAEIYHEQMSPGVRHFILRQQMMMTVTHLRDVAGPDVWPERALLAVPEDDNSSLDEQALGCPCHFDRDVHQLHYPADILDQEPRFANSVTYAWLEENCEVLLGHASSSTGLTGRISQLLTRSPNLSLTMESVADLLGMSERTLRRRLETEGTRFADIVDDVRKSRALQLVQKTGLSADEIALKIGFSDTSNLRRAVKRWTGKTFRETRQQ